MATEEKTQVSQAHMDERFNEILGYIDTAVGTLTTEMDRQFKEVRGEIAEVRGAMDRQFQEFNGKLDNIQSDVQAIKDHLLGDKHDDET